MSGTKKSDKIALKTIQSNFTSNIYLITYLLVGTLFRVNIEQMN